MNTVTPPAGAKTLLIVEDDILSAMTLRDALEDAGFEVLDLTDRVADAIVAVEARKPDLALVNINLHGHDDGIGLAGHFQTMDVPVLFISGQVSRARSAQTVAVGSLPKPYKPSDIVMAVQYLLHHLAGDETSPRPDRLEVFERPAPGDPIKVAASEPPPPLAAA